MTTQFDTLRARLPDFHAFFAATNVFWIALVLAGTKVCHELGHALVCKRFGGQCHELGLMLLVFVPCLYVNVSDTWMLPNKWQRAAVVAAGLWVELVLAAVCTLLWWFSEPGLFNTLCLNTMFVCSVSTRPVQRQPAAALRRLLHPVRSVGAAELVAGVARLLAARAAPLVPGAGRSGRGGAAGISRVWLGGYGLASSAYRLVVLAGIVWFLLTVLRPYRLQVLAHGVVGVMIVGALTVPLIAAGRLLSNPVQRRSIRRSRLVLVGGLLAAVAVGVGGLPVPARVTAPLVLEPQGAQRVYVTVAGMLTDVAVRPGAVVTAGQRLARLENLELAREVARLEGSLRQQQTVVANLEARRGADPEARVQIPAAQQALEDIRQRLQQQRDEQQKLTLVAPADGVMISPPRVPPPQRPTRPGVCGPGPARRWTTSIAAACWRRALCSA